MPPPAPIVQISPAVAQEVIALQAAELVRLRSELGNERVRGISTTHLRTEADTLR